MTKRRKYDDDDDDKGRPSSRKKRLEEEEDKQRSRRKNRRRRRHNSDQDRDPGDGSQDEDDCSRRSRGRLGDDDIWVENEDSQHPGTRAFRKAIRRAVKEFDGDEYSKSVFKYIVRDELGGGQYTFYTGKKKPRLTEVEVSYKRGKLGELIQEAYEEERNRKRRQERHSTTSAATSSTEEEQRDHKKQHHQGKGKHRERSGRSLVDDNEGEDSTIDIEERSEKRRRHKRRSSRRDDDDDKSKEHESDGENVDIERGEHRRRRQKPRRSRDDDDDDDDARKESSDEKMIDIERGEKRRRRRKGRIFRGNNDDCDDNQNDDEEKSRPSAKRRGRASTKGNRDVEDVSKDMVKSKQKPTVENRGGRSARGIRRRNNKPMLLLDKEEGADDSEKRTTASTVVLLVEEEDDAPRKLCLTDPAFRELIRETAIEFKKAPYSRKVLKHIIKRQLDGLPVYVSFGNHKKGNDYYQEATNTEIKEAAYEIYEEERYMLSAKSRDVYFDVEHHSGTLKWQKVVRSVVVDNFRMTTTAAAAGGDEEDVVVVEFDKSMYKEIKKRLQNASYFIGRPPNCEQVASRSDLLERFQKQFEIEKVKLTQRRLEVLRSRQPPIPGTLYWRILGQTIATAYRNWTWFHTKKAQCGKKKTHCKQWIARQPAVIQCREWCTPYYVKARQALHPCYTKALQPCYSKTKGFFKTDPDTERDVWQRIAKHLEITVFGHTSMWPFLILMLFTFSAIIFLIFFSILKKIAFDILGIE